jgi:RTC4-like domain
MLLLTLSSTDFILLELREPLQLARLQSSLVDHSIPDYVLLVLTPTLVLRLIMDDMSLGMVEAHRVMTESAGMGIFFNGDDGVI